jgi:L-iditol 2-dehydrogenase
MKGTMRVAMYYNNNDVRLEEMPVPEIDAGELLVKVMGSGICGSDVMEWYRIKKAPLVLGHEISGEVVEVGKGLKDFKVGDRVSASHHVPCNECHHCQEGNHTICDLMHTTTFDPGGFSEYLRVPGINVEKGGVYPLPENISWEAGTFTEPLACVLRAQRRAGLKKGQTVLVLGAGVSGMLHIHLASVRGAALVACTDVSEYRLDMAKRFGANVAFGAERYDAGKLREVNDGRLADVVVLCTGATSAIEQAMDSVEKGGTVVFFAPSSATATIPKPLNDIFWRKDVTLTTSYAGGPEDHLGAISLMESGEVRVAEMITHRLGLEDAVQGFKLVAEAGDSLKVIIEPQR